MATQTEFEESSAMEVCREDSRGKFITLADHTDFPKFYQYMFHTPVKDRSGDGKVRAPYNKMAISLIVYQEPKGSFTQYMDVDDFLLFCDRVTRIHYVESKVELQSFIGFSEKSGTARSLTVIAQPALKDANKVSFMLSFTKGKATPNDSGTGFKWSTDKTSSFIAVDQDAMKRFCLTGQQHVLAARTAALTRYYGELYK